MSEVKNPEVMDASLFELVGGAKNHDQAFETKPVSYLRDCFRRFRKNKGSVVAAIIILIIALYAIIVPMASPKSYVDSVAYPNGYMDSVYQYALPCNPMFRGSGFWDGTKEEIMNETAYNLARFTDANMERVIEVISVEERTAGSIVLQRSYRVKVDDYARGVRSVNLTPDRYNALRAYEEEQGIAGVEGKSILKPNIDYRSYVSEYCDELTAEGVNSNLVTSIRNSMLSYYNQNGSIYYELSAFREDTGRYQDTYFYPVLDAEGEPIDVYQRDADGNLVYGVYSNGDYNVRVDYFDYHTWYFGFEPYMYFGANAQGQDIFLRLANGARFSLLLGVCISFINFIIGLIWGAISGYYGGTVDLMMERITDIIGNVPSVIILTICSISFTSAGSPVQAIFGSGGTIILAFLIAFVYSGWIGTASTTRMQFYRFKGQEYVLASRTLGAKDSRLIFRHILPNAAGTLVTSSVLMIPGVIFSETSLSYLGIVNFSTSGLVSIGSLLEEGQASLMDNPHIILFPCVVIALLMICFNLFGNGLRDAFNTSLKGAED